MNILSLGEKIKKLRKEKNMTLKELAGDRITAAQISHIERDKSHTSYELLEYLSERLDVSIDYLLETKEMQIEYRKLSEKDLNTFIEMRINQLREEGAKEDIDLKPALLDYYTRHMKDGTFVSWIAVDNGKIIGTSGMSFVEKPPYFGCPSGRIGLLSSMFTNPNYRRRGIAKELLNRVVDEARDYGCGTIQITASDMGVKLYTAYGFVHNGNFMQYKL